MMVDRLRGQLLTEFPEYAELDALLGLASLTWQKYGISAGDLSELEDVQREMVWLALQK